MVELDESKGDSASWIAILGFLIMVELDKSESDSVSWIEILGLLIYRTRRVNRLT